MYLNNLQSYTFATLMLLFVAFVACDRENPLAKDRTYEGTFYTKNLPQNYTSTSFTLKLDKGRFDFEPLDNSPMKHSSGTFILKDNQVTFHDENMWTADFDWNLIFSGDFDLSSNKQEITLTKNGENNYKYIYVLKRQ